MDHFKCSYHDHLKINNFRSFFMKNWHKTVNFQNFEIRLSEFVPLFDVVIWCKVQPISTKIEGAETYGIKYCKTSNLYILYMTYNQNSELQNAITFQWNLIPNIL